MVEQNDIEKGIQGAPSTTPEQEKTTQFLHTEEMPSTIELSPEDKDKIRRIENDIDRESFYRGTETHQQITNAVQERDDGSQKTTFATVAPQKARGSKWFRNFVVGTAALFGVSFGAKGEAKGASLPDSLKNKNEKVASMKAQNDSISGLKVYPGGKTKEGATTPTGFNNSFFNNEYGIGEEDVEMIAKQFGFRTDNIEHFQSDMFGRLEKDYPEEMKKVLKKYDLPAAGKMVDKILGIRTAFVLSIFKNKIPVTPEIKGEADPYTAFAKTWEPLYSPSKHIAAQMHYDTRRSSSISQGGVLDTGEEDVMLIFRGDREPELNAPRIIVKKAELDQLLAGTKYFQSQEKLDELIEKAKKNTPETEVAKNK